MKGGSDLPGKDESKLSRGCALSPSEAEAFISVYDYETPDMRSTFLAFSDRTKEMLIQSRQYGFLDDEGVTEILESALSDYEYGWKDTRGGLQLVEEITQSTLLVLEAMHGYGVRYSTSQLETVQSVHAAVIGFGYRGEGTVSSVPALTTVEEISAAAGVAAYIATAKPYSIDAVHLISRVDYHDVESRVHIGHIISNPRVASYIRENPELGQALCEFSIERGLGDSPEDAQVAINHFIETDGSKAVREGWL